MGPELDPESAKSKTKAPNQVSLLRIALSSLALEPGLAV
jgi:hypothetical protein